MMSTQSILSWFHSNFHTDESKWLYVDEVYHEFKEHFGKGDKKTIGRYVTSAFPNVYRRRQRKFQDWTKYDYYYQGIGRTEQPQTCQTPNSLSNISTDLPEGFFIVEKNNSYVKFGKFTSMSCNGHKVIVEIAVHDNGKLNVTLGGRDVTHQCSVPSEIEVNNASISTVLNCIKSLRYCQGVSVDKIDMINNNMNKENIVIQRNSSKIKVAYSNSCMKILQFNSHKSVNSCQSCRSLANKIDKSAAHSDIPIAPSVSHSNTSAAHHAHSDTSAAHHAHSNTSAAHHAYSDTSAAHHAHSDTSAAHHAHSDTSAAHHAHSDTSAAHHAHSDTSAAHHAHSDTSAAHHAHSNTSAAHHAYLDTSAAHHAHSDTSAAHHAHSDTSAAHHAHSDIPIAHHAHSDIPIAHSDISTAHSDTSTGTATPQDIISILKDKAPFLSETQLSFFESQLKISQKRDVHGRRWDNATIQLCLPLWTRSPRTYEELSSNGSLILPSVSTLQRHKNAVAQEAGVNEDVFKWMYMEATNQNLPPEGFYGGLILDEMSIQEDLQIVKKDGQVKLVGLTESHTISGDTSLANHVLQYIFHGFTGFRFPVCHFPTKQANSPQLYSSFWDIVKHLQEWGFHVIYSSVDGASTNRSFIKMHFELSPTDNHMAALNPFDGLPVIFLADPSHLFKKIRNNLLKSGVQKWHSRNLFVDGNPVVWKMWIDCYEWDKLHGLSIHQKLRNEHLHPNKAELMRNHLAEEVLDANMLNLMQAYQKHVGNSSAFNGAIALLQQTSQLINIFHDRRPIRDVADERLRHLHSIMEWFRAWEKAGSKSQLMSWETMEDVQFLTVGFCRLVRMAITELNIPVTPLYINSDIVENLFSQQRGLYHGSGANPNYNQYRTATNSIILGQSTISKKSNASRGKTNKSQGAMPFRHLCKKLRM